MHRQHRSAAQTPRIYCDAEYAVQETQKIFVTSTASGPPPCTFSSFRSTGMLNLHGGMRML